MVDPQSSTLNLPPDADHLMNAAAAQTAASLKLVTKHPAAPLLRTLPTFVPKQSSEPAPQPEPVQPANSKPSELELMREQMASMQRMMAMMLEQKSPAPEAEQIEEDFEQAFKPSPIGTVNRRVQTLMKEAKPAPLPPQEPLVSAPPSARTGSGVVSSPEQAPANPVMHWLSRLQVQVEKRDPWKTFRKAVVESGYYSPIRWPGTIAGATEKRMTESLADEDFLVTVVRGALMIEPTLMSEERLYTLAVLLAGWDAFISTFQNE